MLDRAKSHIIGNMRKASLIEGLFRKDIPEYPEEALREALANAESHRDYSDYVKGSYIQVRMFADRLEIQSPGGLHGSVTTESIEDEQSTRNARLMRMMEDLRIVENRGSGIGAMLRSLREANLEPPAFKDRRASFLVTFHNHTLMNPIAVAWLNQFSDRDLNDRQRLALIFMRQHTWINNSDYRRLNRVDALTAGQDLRGLVEAELAEQIGARRATRYKLMNQITDQATVQVTDQVGLQSEVSARVIKMATEQVTAQVAVQVLELCREPRKASEIQKELAIKHRPTFRKNYLNPLLNEGWLEMTIPDKPTVPKQKYKLTIKGRNWLNKNIEP